MLTLRRKQISMTAHSTNYVHKDSCEPKNNRDKGWTSCLLPACHVAAACNSANSHVILFYGAKPRELRSVPPHIREQNSAPQTRKPKRARRRLHELRRPWKLCTVSFPAHHAVHKFILKLSLRQACLKQLMAGLLAEKFYVCMNSEICIGAFEGLGSQAP